MLFPGSRLFILLAAFVTALTLQAQRYAGGSIYGTVRNAETDAYLEGALVELLDRDRSMLTDRTGSFSFGNLPEGSYKLRITYTGLDDQIVDVDVVGAAPVVKDIAMSAEIYQLETYRVTGSLEGNAAAITSQKVAPNVVNVVSMDAYGNVADGNIGNFLQRLPGIDVSKSNGDINGFGLRGIPQALSTISMDGEMLPAASAGGGGISDRSYPIDNMPAELVSNLRVTKSPTADMPADSLGGNIDFRSKSALDFNGQRILYTMGLNNNLYRHHTKWTPSGSFTYMNRYGEFGDTGLTITGSYSETENTRDRIQNTYSNSGVASNPFMMNTRIRMLDDTFNRKRMGGSIKLEHRFTDKLTAYVAGTFTRLDYDTDRYDYRVGANSRYLYDGANATWDNYTIWRVSPMTVAYNDARLNEMYRVNGGFDFKTEKTELNFKVSHGDARSTFKSFMLCGTYDRAITGTQHPLAFNVYGGRERPHFTLLPAGNPTAGNNSPPDGFNFYDPASLNYYTGEYLTSYENVRDKVDQMSLDWKLKRPGFLGGFAEFLKTGASVRVKDYRRLRDDRRFSVVDPNNPSATRYGLIYPFANAQTGYDLFHGYYDAFPSLDVDAARTYYDSTPTALTANASNRDQTPSELKDKVFSGYLMGDFGYRKFWVMAGVRYEYTKTTGRGDALPDSHLLTGYLPGMDDPGNLNTDFSDFFPSIHMRYYLTKNLILRASWAKSMGRPAINKQVPGYTIRNDPDGEATNYMEVNNTDLRPMYSDNYDISAEYYFKKAGVVSVGLFMKKMDGFMYRNKIELPNDPSLGQWAGYTVRSEWNMDNEAKVKGIEFNYSQVLDFLPSFLRDTRLLLNCTYQSSSGTYGNDQYTSGGIGSGSSELLGFKPFVGNAALMFKFKRLEMHVFLNYNKAYHASYSSSDINENYYIDDDLTVDLNFKYQFHRRFTIFCDINNVFDHSPDAYLSSDNSLIRSYEKNGTRLNVGISGRW